ncbi:GFA family protein [Reyranella sp.]|uniref:GFA family protein n=1 Tax=Reyranella sp. TaxID=1929291 RepID=UPI003BA9C263
MRQGRCLCGDVRFVAEGSAKWTAYCHCGSCRRHTGAPVAAYAGFETSKVRFTGAPLAFYESSPGVRRGFCARCGSTLTYEGDRWPGEIHLHVGAFDDPADLAPTGQAFGEERISWLDLPAGQGSGP